MVASERSGTAPTAQPAPDLGAHWYRALVTKEDERRQAIRAELSRIEESAMVAAQTQLEQSKRWSRANLWLGISSSAAAGVAGTLALAQPELAVVAGPLALIAAVLGVILTSLNANARTNAAASAGNAYLSVQNDARQARLVDLDHESVEEMRGRLAELTARRDEQNKTAEVPSQRAYRRAQANIKEGGQSYAVDEPAGDPQ